MFFVFAKVGPIVKTDLVELRFDLVESPKGFT